MKSRSTARVAGARATDIGAPSATVTSADRALGAVRVTVRQRGTYGVSDAAVVQINEGG